MYRRIIRTPVLFGNLLARTLLVRNELVMMMIPPKGNAMIFSTYRRAKRRVYFEPYFFLHLHAVYN